MSNSCQGDVKMSKKVSKYVKETRVGGNGKNVKYNYSCNVESIIDMKKYVKRVENQVKQMLKRAKNVKMMSQSMAKNVNVISRRRECRKDVKKMSNDVEEKSLKPRAMWSL